MKNPLEKVFLASAMGAGLGSIVAMSVSEPFWWIGLIVGGLTGYFSYEWRQVLVALTTAWHQTITWRPPKNTKAYLLAFVKFQFLLWVWCFTITLILYNTLNASDGVPIAETSVFAFQGSLIMFFIGSVSILLMDLTYPDPVFFNTKELVTHTNNIHWMGYVPPILLGWGALHLFWFVLQLCGELVQAIPKLLWQFFCLVHSERRLICGVDATLGAAIGFGLQSAVVGALIGGLLGVLNYEFVTRKWLIPNGYVTERT